MPCLQKRGEVWHFYRRVPADLQPVIGATFIRKSLKTGDNAEARRRVVKHIGDTDEKFELIRKGEWPLASDHDYAVFGSEFAQWIAEEMGTLEHIRAHGANGVGAPVLTEPIETEADFRTALGTWIRWSLGDRNSSARDHTGPRPNTVGSERRVPIHPELAKLDFLEYVDSLRQKGGDRLFPDLRPREIGGDTHWTINYSKWWARYRAQMGLDDPRKPFHSFRHAFKDAARNSDVERSKYDELQGHTDGTASTQYGLGSSLVALNRAMQKLGYADLDLSHLYR